MPNDKRDIQADRKMCDSATPGPWEPNVFAPPDLRIEGEMGVHCPEHPEAYIQPDGTWYSITVCRGMSGTNKVNNAEFIAESRTALPHYLDRCEEGEAALEAAIDSIIIRAISQVYDAQTVCTRLTHEPGICQRSNGDCHECYRKLFMQQGKEAVKHV